MALLSERECAQAAAFRVAVARRRFIVRRAARRLVLARYVNRPASALKFLEDSMGKPKLDSCQDLDFNCSASGDLALIGVARGKKLGLDVERLRAVPDALGIAGRFFAKGEFEMLARAPAAQRSASFLRLWTCKEAWTKACGLGFSRPFDSFKIDCGPVPKLVRGEADESEAHAWQIQQFSPAPGFIGALAVEAPV